MTILQRLRNRESVTLYKEYTDKRKRFFRIQINKNANTICWQRFVSADKRSWTKLNDCLSLKEVVRFIQN